ncbi:DUF2164 domain-containing protein [Paenibacillus sp. sgz500958]|uniref:DUF2164 domain-containing protein n=1 Tax=Paenibacillus sp. sgz500958 TaxID=3242475 RepID=UPI0036D40668
MINIKLPKEEKAELVRSIQAYFEEERSETLGDLGAEQLLDFMLGEIGPYVYNKAVSDARTLVGQKMLQIEDEMYALEQPMQRRTR